MPMDLKPNARLEVPQSDLRETPESQQGHSTRKLHTPGLAGWPQFPLDHHSKPAARSFADNHDRMARQPNSSYPNMLA